MFEYLLFIPVAWCFYNTWTIHRAIKKYHKLPISEPPAKIPRNITDIEFHTALNHFCPSENPGAVLDQVSQLTEDVIRESSAMLAGGSAVMIQVLHPKIGADLIQQSSINQGIFQRFDNTFRYVFTITFGDWQQAHQQATRLWSIHKRFPNAVDFNATKWVFYTLIYHQILMYEVMIRELSEKERDQIVRDKRVFASCYGIPVEEMPTSWEQFIGEYCEYLGELSFDEATISEINLLLFQKPKQEARFGLLKIISKFLLTDQLLERLRYRRGCLDYLAGLLLLGVVKSIYLLLPIQMRVYTSYKKLRNIGGIWINNLTGQLVQWYFKN
jgi:uncharacterized protein (DUF2236 family)